MNPVILEFVIEGLEAFVSGINDANDALEKLKYTAPTSIFETAWSSLSNAITSFGEKVWDVATVTIGVLLRDAIRGAIDFMGELGKSSFEAAMDLQEIQFRLQGFNLQAAVDSGMDYNAAMEKSIKVTEEQMNWIMRLAAQTPFDATDVGYVFSMAEAFGFASDEAKQLTEDTANFVAAMGLSSIEQKRVIINLGQMVQRGKITTREMNDLARGSLLPLADVLGRVAKKMNITTAELTALISKPGEGVDYRLFMEAFNEMTNTEVRFQNAAQRMAYVFRAAMDNVYQSTRDIIGNFILIPGIIGPIGDRVAKFMEVVTKPENWDKITVAARKVGDSLGRIVNKLINLFFPSTMDQTLVDRIVSGLETISAWLDTKGSKFVEFLFGTGGKWKIFPGVEMEGGIFENIGKIIEEKVIPFINGLVSAFQTISDWVRDNQPLITEFFTTLGDIVGGIFTNLTSGLFSQKAGEKKSGLAGFLDTIARIMQWIIDNKDKIEEVGTSLTRLWIALELGKLTINIIMGFLGLLLDQLLKLIGWGALLAGTLGVGIFSVWAVIDEKGGEITGFFDTLPGKIDETNKKKIDWAKIFSPESISTFFTNIQTTIDEYDFNQLGHTIMKKLVDGLNNAKPLIVEFLVGKGGLVPMTETELGEPAPWLRIGVKIITEIIKGVVSVEWQLIKIIGEIIAGAFAEAFKNLPVFGGSPEGWTGRGRSAPNSEPSEPAGPRLNRRDKGNLVSTVSNAMALVSVPTSPSSSISSSAVVNNYMNLVVNSAAPVESVVQDYAMMQALVG